MSPLQGSARVIRCLQTQRDKLSSSCRATLFDEEVRFSENIDFQYPMKKACEKEVQVFCKDVPHGNARVIRCLQDNKDNKDFGQVWKAKADLCIWGDIDFTLLLGQPRLWAGAVSRGMCKETYVIY